MPEYHILLAKEPTRLGAMDALIMRLKIRDHTVAARFSEAGRNLAEEASLDITFWRELADFLLHRGTTLSLTDIENELQIIFRKFQKMGPEVKGSRSLRGRFFKRSDFVDLLTKGRSGKTTLPRKKAEAIKRLLVSTAAKATKVLWFRELGRHLMWSTYCEICDCGDPFNPKAPDAKLVDSLGLIFKAGDQFLAFVYEIPLGVDRFTPTIADAYGGGFFFPFRTGGRTNPIRYQDELSGRPEVVHQTIMGRFLRDTVRLVKPLG